MSILNNTTPVLHQNPPPIDEDEFLMEQRISDFRSKIRIVLDSMVSFAIVLGVLGVLLFLTILSSKLRSRSPVWYYYHLIGLSVVTALFIHTFYRSAVHIQNKSLCFFLAYTAEYIFFALGINILLMNFEIYFTTVLPLQRWQWNPFFRFVITILIGWIAVGGMVNYIIINNNDARDRKYGCFYIRDKSIRTIRTLLNIYIPGGLCFLFTIVLIGTHCLKRTRFAITSASGELREVKTVTNAGEMEWTRAAVYVNMVYVLRCAMEFVINYGNLGRKLDTYMALLAVLSVHATTMYLLPLGLLFVGDARATLKVMIFKGMSLVSCGKVRLGEDLEQLVVSYDPDSGTNFH